jgi:hypothetical protein
VDAFLILFILVTAGGLIILLFCGLNGPAVPSVSASDSGRIYTTNDGPRPVAPSLLSSCGLGDPGETIIWSTQIRALRFVCGQEPQGTSCADLKPIYVELARRYPEIYDGHTFHGWGQLLVDLDLFRVEAKRVHITSSGRALLEMLLAVTERQSHEIAWQ